MKCNKVFFFDLDGTIYHGESPIQGAKECIEYLQKHKISFYFLTNNAYTKTNCKETGNNGVF